MLAHRSAKQCRDRFFRVAHPGIKKGAWSHVEEVGPAGSAPDMRLTMMSLHGNISFCFWLCMQWHLAHLYSVMGPRWSRIARALGRSDNDVKNAFVSAGS